MLERNSNSEQVTEYEHGIGIEPASKSIIGSQQVPFIYEDRLSGDAVSNAFMKMYEYGHEKRKSLGEAGRKHVLENYNFKDFSEKWEKILLDVYNNKGSWEDRKGYKKWELIAI
jgi:glycosyltransferase involved in cell wall biosynthesis